MWCSRGCLGTPAISDAWLCHVSIAGVARRRGCAAGGVPVVFRGLLEPERAPHGSDVPARHGHALPRRALHDQLQLAPRASLDFAHAREVDKESAVDTQELRSRELDFELLDATNRGLEASFLGDEPDVLTVGLREMDLFPSQQDHALAAHAHDSLRQARARLWPLALERVPVVGAEN